MRIVDEGGWRRYFSFRLIVRKSPPVCVCVQWFDNQIMARNNLFMRPPYCLPGRPACLCVCVWALQVQFGIESSVSFRLLRRRSRQQHEKTRGNGKQGSAESPERNGKSDGYTESWGLGTEQKDKTTQQQRHT